MKLHLRILPRAENDAQVIYDYIASYSPVGALRWWHAFEAATSKLTENVHQFGLARENGLFDLELRQFLFKTPQGRNYRGVFVVVDDELRIIRVRGPGQPGLQPDELRFE